MSIIYSGRPTRTTVLGMPICFPTKATKRFNLSSSVKTIITSLSATSSASSRSKSVPSPLMTMVLSTCAAKASQRSISFSITLTVNPAFSNKIARLRPNKPAPTITARLWKVA